MISGEGNPELTELRRLVNRMDFALSRAMMLAQYPRECWGEAEDAQLKDLFQECAELHALRKSLGLTGGATHPEGP